jgi:bifunctional non-homologous end joining protein LigD
VEANPAEGQTLEWKVRLKPDGTSECVYSRGMARRGEQEVLTVAGREVAISNPRKVLFPQAGYTKLDVARYYVAMAEGALLGAGDRPNVLVRYPNGIDDEFFYQKRAPESRPDWIEVVTLKFPSGRSAEEVVPRDAATLVWMANLACLELHPHPVRAEDLDHPDELRIDLDPVPGIEWPQIREVAKIVHAALGDYGLTGWPKTSGSRGMHVYVRIDRRWTFDQVRQSALAFAREIERRAPALATSKWWKEERHGVFVDYNQNAKDRTIAAAYSIRPNPEARVSAPLAWDEIDDIDPRDFTLATMAARVAAVGHRHRGMNQHAGSLDALLELAARQAADGLGDAPWPPHYRKQPGEAPRVAPSRRRNPAKNPAEAGSHSEGGPGSHKPVRRTPKYPLVEIGRAQKKADALAGVERWKARHPDAAAHLQPADILVDAMRGRFHTWTRTRINLQHVPAELRPAQEPLDPDENPLEEWKNAIERESAGLPRTRKRTPR